MKIAGITHSSIKRNLRLFQPKLSNVTVFQDVFSGSGHIEIAYFLPTSESVVIE